MGHRRHHIAKIFQGLDANDGHIHSYSEIYHEFEYIEACCRGDIAPCDTVLMHAMDGAQLYRDKEPDCWIYIWILQELAEELQYQKKYVMVGGIIPGPHHPTHIKSFLFPGLHHVLALQTEGLWVWDALEKKIHVSYIFFYIATANGPGSVHLTRLVGHHGAFPCQLFCGIKDRWKPGLPHYYPALLKPCNYRVLGCDHPDVDPSSIEYGSADDYVQILAYLLHSHNPTDYKKQWKETGISRPSLISGLARKHCLTITSTLAGDCMHVPTLNLGNLLPALWRGEFQCTSTDNVREWEWAVLHGDIWKDHGEAVHGHIFLAHLIGHRGILPRRSVPAIKPKNGRAISLDSPLPCYMVCYCWNSRKTSVNWYMQCIFYTNTLSQLLNFRWLKNAWMSLFLNTRLSMSRDVWIASILYVPVYMHSNTLDSKYCD
jgi:hypothetical protein